MFISYLVTMEQALNYLGNQGLSGASNTDYENNVKLYRLAAHDKIKQYLGYEFVQTTYTDEIYSGCGKTLLFKNRPVSALTTVKIDDIEQDLSDYSVIDNHLFNSSGLIRGTYNYKLSYIAGYIQANMPADIRLAALQLIALYQGMNGGAGTTIGKSSISNGSGGSESIDTEAENRILESLMGYQKIW